MVSFEEPPRPRRLNKAIPTDLETIVLKAIEKNPAHRYATARELAEDLQRFIDDRPIQARRPTVAQRGAKWCRRHRSLVSTVAVAVVVVLATVAAGSSVLAWRLNRVAEQENAIATQEKAVAAREKRANQSTARLLAASYSQRGQALCEDGQIATGMLWMAHSLDVAPNDAHKLRRAIRRNLAAWRPYVNSLVGQFADPQGVQSAAISPDGTRVVTGSAKGRIRLWDAASGEMIEQRQGHVWKKETTGRPRERTHVSTVSFSPDGSRILTSSADSTARLWDAKSLEPIGKPLEHLGDKTEWIRRFGMVWRAVFSPSGDLVATCGGNAAQLWNAKTGERIGEPLVHPSNRTIRGIAFSPDGSRLVTGAENGIAIVWDVKKQEEVGQSFKASGQIFALDYSSDGLQIITGSSSGLLQLWDTKTLTEIDEHLQHGGTVYDVDFSSKGALFASGSLGARVRLWNAKTRAPIGQPLRQQNIVWNIDISADESQVVCASLDGTARLWRVAAISQGGTPIESNGASVAFNSDGSQFVAGNQIWETATNRLIDNIPIDNSGKFGLAFGPGPNGPRIASIEWKNVRIWDAKTLKPVGESFPHPAEARAVSFSPDGTHIATACRDGNLRLWNIATRAVKLAGGHEGWVLDLAFSPDGSWIVTAGFDHTVRFWNAKTLQPIKKPIQCSSLVTGIAVSPDSKRIATVLLQGTGRVWSVAERTTIGTPMQHRNEATDVAFSPDGSLIVTVGDDRAARFWDVETGQPVGPPLINEHALYDVTYSPDGKHILVANRLWGTPPPPVDGVDEQIRLSVEVLTGMELDMDSGGAATVLDGPAWRSRRRRLEELGGPPSP